MILNLSDAFVIGQDNFNEWSQGFDESGYLRILPHPEKKILFKDPFFDWQQNQPGNYVSSWGPEKDLEVVLKAEDLEQIDIDGFGILKAGDGKIPWLNNQDNPYEFLRGFNGTIPGPMLITEPGDTLKIKLVNDLRNPEQPINLHTHGLHVSPKGHGDNVLVSIDPGENRDVEIKIPENQSIGTNWYHPHLHGLSNQQISAGLGGQLWVGPPHDIQDLDKWDPKNEHVYFMALNTFGIQQIQRQGDSSDPLNQDPSQSLPAGTPLEVIDEAEGGKKVYTTSDAVNQGHNSKPIGYDPLNPLGNAQGTLPIYGAGFSSAEPLENVIYTVNSQYNPTLELKTGEWNTFNFSNISADTFHVIQLVKQEGDQLVPVKVGVIGMDGHSSAIATDQAVEAGELPLLNPASRISIQKQFEEPGTYYVLSNGTEEILGENTSSLIKGNKGFNDGFSLWGSQVLATFEVTGDVEKASAPPESYEFVKERSKTTNELTEIAESNTFDRERTYTWVGNFGQAVDPTTLEGAWRINGEYFATTDPSKNMIPLTMPMLGTSELWNINNASGKSDPSLSSDIPFTEWHPFHIHQNDFTVLSVNGVSLQDQENQYFNGIQRDSFPLAPTHASGSPNQENPYGTIETNGETSSTQMLMKFEDFPGTFVNHCHILAHQDAGMMIPVRTILNTEKTWLGLGAQANSGGKVKLFRANNLEQRSILSPYGKNFKGSIDVAIGDINYKNSKDTENVTDNVTDVATIQTSLSGKRDKFKVKVFDGQSLIQEQEDGRSRFDGKNQELVLTEFTPFEGVNVSPKAKASIAVGDINGDGYSDIVVGEAGDGMASIEIYSGEDFHLLYRIAPFHHETNFKGSLNLAVGDVDADNYEDVIVSQGEGGRGLVELYSGKMLDEKGTLDGRKTAHETALLSQPFQPYGDSYTGEIEVTSGYILQRPEVSNGEAVQTYHANITTMAVNDVPEGQEQIKVFTSLKDEHHGSMHQTSTDSMMSEHDSLFNGFYDPSELRLDQQFTPDRKVTDLSGTFADIPNLSRGEPVLYALDITGTPELIYLQEKNIPTSIPMSPNNMGIGILQNKNDQFWNDNSDPLINLNPLQSSTYFDHYAHM